MKVLLSRHPSAYGTVISSVVNEIHSVAFLSSCQRFTPFVSINYYFLLISLTPGQEIRESVEYKKIRNSAIVAKNSRARIGGGRASCILHLVFRSYFGCELFGNNAANIITKNNIYGS